MGDPQTVVTSSGASGSASSGTFGQYTLVRKLADGGMAEIFLAKQIGAGGFERNVVIKRILPNLSGHAEFVSMFLDEARLAAKFSHPNIVQVTDAGLAEGAYYLCMEYLAGEDFATLLRSAAQKGQRTPLGVCVRVVIDAAHGLHYAHEFTDETGTPMQVVHRDVSPSNIFVTYQGSVKVLDFGIAKAESRATHTRSGTVKGKFVYMSPEQVRGEIVDRRSDVFALGIVLYEALTGTRPFARENDLAVMNAIIKGEIRPLRELRPDLPEEIETIISQAMMLDADQRYPTAAALAKDLERFLSRVDAESTSQEVGRYTRAIVGETRINSRSRIPTLQSLLASGATVRGFTDPSVASVPAPAIASTSERATAGHTMPQQHAAESPAAKKRRSVLGYVATALGVIAVGAGTGVVMNKLQQPAETPAPSVVTAPAMPPASLVATPTPPAPAQQAPPAPAPAPSAAATTPAPAPQREEPKPAAPAAPAPKPVVRQPRGPVRLDAATIQGVVLKKSGAVASCFETHKGDLVGDAGEIRVQFTILASGKVVNAHAVGGLAGTKVAGCVEERVTALKFPQHQDKEITLSLPFSYRVTR